MSTKFMYKPIITITQSYQLLLRCGLLLCDPSKIVFRKSFVLLRDGHWSTMIFPWFPYYEYGICIYSRWTMLKIHLPPKVNVGILACVMTNHIFIPCRWSIVLHLNLSKMEAGSCKIWFSQSSWHPNRLWTCLIVNPKPTPLSSS